MHNALGSSSSKDQGYRTVKCEQVQASMQTIETGSSRLPGDGGISAAVAVATDCQVSGSPYHIPAVMCH